MSATHFLPDPFIFFDRQDDSIHHEMELFEQGGRLFVRLWIGGVEANNPVVGEMSRQNAHTLAECAQKFAARLG